MQCGLCGFLIIKPQIALHQAMQCTVTYNAVQFSHFIDNFGVSFSVCEI